MLVSPARSAAFDILLRAERDAAYSSELLHSRALDELSVADRGLTTELVMGVLRWRSRLDDLLANVSSQPLIKLDLEVLISLRLAAYQFGWLDRIPQRAALHESVELVKRARKRSAASFVNAVLRRLSSTNVHPVILQPNGSDTAESLATAYAHPPWITERWVNEYGFSAAKKICEHDQSVPPTSIRLRAPEAEEALSEQGIDLTAGSMLSTARKVQRGDVTKTKAFRTGQFVIQDEASQLVASLVGKGSTILDCCAAPGGKTLAIADRNPQASITALELHPHRAHLLQRLLRKGLSSQGQIHVVVADARHLPVTGSYSRVLADVPCSGTGTLSRNPEIKWRLTQADLQALHQRQVEILLAAMDHVAPGGRLIYSTCSLEREENEDVVAEALTKKTGFRTVNCSSELEHLKADGELTSPDIACLTRGPYLRTLSGTHPCDGFFAAILEKTGPEFEVCHPTPSRNHTQGARRAVGSHPASHL